MEHNMAVLPLILGPNPVFRQRAEAVQTVDDTIRQLCDDMLETLYQERGIGMGANMVGVLKQIIVVDLQEDGERKPLVCINPEITKKSETLIAREEASLCFPGIRAEITRPDSIEITYLDTNGEPQTLATDGWLATVIQHEMEYLQGRTFLDNLSKVKRDRLIKKMQKQMKSTCTDPHCCSGNN
jgi:peptide deformylase